MSNGGNIIGSRIAKGSDKRLHDFPRPTLAVDTALLTVDPERAALMVVEMERDDVGKWALPGAFVRKGDTLAQTVQRCLREKLNVEGVRPRQLHVFDDPHRDHRDWVVTVAHVAVVRPEQIASLGEGLPIRTRLAPVDRPGELAWDHPQIVKLAKEYVRSRYEVEPDPERILGPRFTLSELKSVHEAVLGEEIDRSAFRRAMKDLVVDTGDRTNTGGRPAVLYRRKTDRD